MYRLQQRSWQTRKLLGEVAAEVIFIGEHPTLRTRPPTEHDRRLVHHALALFTPWGSPHVPLRLPTYPCWKPTLVGLPHVQTGSGSMP
jgi:hypothetical protein